MHLFGKIVAGIFGGFVVAFLASNIATLVSKDTGALVLLVSWAASIYIAVKSQRVARAWRWQLIISGCLCFVLPLATLIFSTQQESGARMLVGVVATGVLGFVAFLFGLALLVVGLLVGRNPNVVVIQSNN